MPVDLRCRVTMVRERALYVTTEPGDEVYWLPRSQLLGEVPDEPVEEPVVLRLTDWIARQKQITSNCDEVDLERFDVGPSITENSETWIDVVDRHSGPTMCKCDDIRKARMIAAALNLTQGKV